MIRFLFTGVVTLMVGSSAIARDDAFFDGNDLYKTCQQVDGPSIARCIGYIDGVTDEMLAYLGGKGCLPPGLTESKLHDVVVGYLRDHPAERNSSAATVVGAAIQRAWCWRR
jgi:hypothetical protein